jgi:hypothetical protein
MLLDLERALSRYAATTSSLYSASSDSSSAAVVPSSKDNNGSGDTYAPQQHHNKQQVYRQEGMLLAFGWRFRRTVALNERLQSASGRFRRDDALALHAGDELLLLLVVVD